MHDVKFLSLEKPLGHSERSEESRRFTICLGDSSSLAQNDGKKAILNFTSPV